MCGTGSTDSGDPQDIKELDPSLTRNTLYSICLVGSLAITVIISYMALRYVPLSYYVIRKATGLLPESLLLFALGQIGVSAFWALTGNRRWELPSYIIFAVWTTIFSFYLIAIGYHGPLLFDPNLEKYHWRRNSGVIIKGPFYAIARVSVSHLPWAWTLCVIIVTALFHAYIRANAGERLARNSALILLTVATYGISILSAALLLSNATVYHQYKLRAGLPPEYIPLFLCILVVIIYTRHIHEPCLTHIAVYGLIFISARSASLVHQSLYATVTRVPLNLVFATLLMLLSTTYTLSVVLTDGARESLLASCRRIDKRYYEMTLFIACFLLINYLSLLCGRYSAILSRDDNRLALTAAIVEENSFFIENQRAGIGVMDIAFRDGHYYCGKSPGIGFILIPGYLVGKVLSNTAGIHPLHVCLIEYYMISATLPVAVWKTTRKLGRNSICGLLAALCAMFATPFLIFAPYVGWSYSTTATAAAWAMERVAGRVQRKVDLIISAQFCVLAVMCDYVFGIFGIILSLSVIHRGQHSAIYIISLLPLATLIALYHTVCFGAPYLTGYHFHVDKDTSASSTWYGGKHWIRLISGFDENIFIFCPFLGIAIIGFIMWWRDERFTDQRSLLLVPIGTLIGYYVFYSNWPYRMGESLSSFHWPSLIPRFMTPSLVLMPILLVPVFEALRERGLGKLLIAVFLTVTTVGVYYALLCGAS